jgi:glucose/mannose transport system substrate-binding protein
VKLTQKVLIDYGGKKSIYSVPHSVLRADLLFYNRTMLQEQKIDPPRTIAELLAACEKLKRAGIPAFAVSFERVSLGAMFNGLAQGVLGPELYAQWADGKFGSDSSVLTEPVNVFGTVLENYTKNTGVTIYDLSASAKLLVGGEVAMYYDGSWSAGSLQQLGWVYGPDFGAIVPPGASGLFQFFLSIFAMPAEAPHPDIAKDYLRVIATPEAEIASSTILGGIPPRTDVDQRKLSPFVRDNLKAYENAKVFETPIVRPEWGPAYVQFANDHDKAKLLKAFSDFPPIPQP